MGTVNSCVRSMDMDAFILLKIFIYLILLLSQGEIAEKEFIMNNMFIVKGFLAKSFEVKVANNGKSYAVGAVAVATGTTDAQGKKVYNYLPIKAFGKTAELMNKHLQHGDYVELSGQLSMNSNYSKDGKTVYGTMFCAVREFSRLSQRETAKPVEVIEPEVIEPSATIL